MNRNASAFMAVVSVVSGIGLPLLLFGIFSSNPSVPAGHEGYVYEKPRLFGQGGFKDSVTGPANYGISINRNRVINIDMRPGSYKETFGILAKDDLNISFDFHAILSVRSGSVKDVVEKYGAEHWYNRYVKATFRTYVRDAVQKYNSSDLKTQRAAIETEVTQELQTFLATTPFNVHKVVVGDITYPKIVASAVEKKLAAQQLLAEKETQKEIARKDAEIRVEEARGIAEAQKIINATLTSNYLQHEAINAQLKMAESPNHTTVYIPVGTNGIPLVKGMR